MKAFLASIALALFFTIGTASGKTPDLNSGLKPT
jgi:hypothetical protein